MRDIIISAMPEATIKEKEGIVIVEGNYSIAKNRSITYKLLINPKDDGYYPLEALIKTSFRLPFESEGFRKEIVHIYQASTTPYNLSDFTEEKIILQWEKRLNPLELFDFIQKFYKNIQLLDKIALKHTPRLDNH